MGFVCALPEIYSERQEPLPAQFHIGRISLGCCSVLIRMLQRKQELPASRVIVQKLHVRSAEAVDDLLVIPGKIVFLLILSVDVREIPPMDMSDLLFCFPLFSKRFDSFRIHIFYP